MVSVHGIVAPSAKGFPTSARCNDFVFRARALVKQPRNVRLYHRFEENFCFPRGIRVVCRLFLNLSVGFRPKIKAATRSPKVLSTPVVYVMCLCNSFPLQASVSRWMCHAMRSKPCPP